MNTLLQELLNKDDYKFRVSEQNYDVLELTGDHLHLLESNLLKKALRYAKNFKQNFPNARYTTSSLQNCGPGRVLKLSANDFRILQNTCTTQLVQTIFYQIIDEDEYKKQSNFFLLNFVPRQTDKEILLLVIICFLMLQFI